MAEDTFSGLAALSRAQKAVGTTLYPQGHCLEHQFQWAGIPQSIGPYAGQYPNAYTAWVHSSEKHPDTLNPPAGSYIVFGPSLTRTDALKDDGDIGISDGNYGGIFTDASGAAVGRMSITARGTEIKRPYLGYITEFCGWKIQEFIPTPDYSLGDPMLQPYRITDETGKTLGFVELNTVNGVMSPIDEPHADVDAGAFNTPIIPIQQPQLSEISAKIRSTNGKFLTRSDTLLLVESAYRTYLGRDADTQGLQVFSDYLYNGGTVDGMVQSIKNSPEYKSKGNAS